MVQVVPKTSPFSFDRASGGEAPILYVRIVRTQQGGRGRGGGRGGGGRGRRRGGGGKEEDGGI